MKSSKTPTATAGLRVDHQRWRQRLDALIDTITPRFARRETARNAGAFVSGVLSSLETKNCWTMAELSGHATPDKLQHLLSRATWEADEIRDDLQAMIVDAFAEPDAVLVVDETGHVKKGTKTVGVQRQYSGTAGRIENCQVAVYMTYTRSKGHALFDRALYLPRSWAEDHDRRTDAGVPEDVEFATKPALATEMITRTLDAGTPAAMGRRRRSLRFLPGPANSIAGEEGRVRPGDRLQPESGHRQRSVPCRRTRFRAAATGVAATVGRGRRQGPALVFVGVDRHR